MIFSVTGCSYGDEGKGLAADHLASHSQKALGVRHNGGAQSGHTVELNGKRFVFHELSSGSFRGADTYWAKTFLPDMYKLHDELTAFRDVSGITPVIFASPFSYITSIDDILINMLLETSRGDARHGSCGMGINEADMRIKAGFGISMKKLFSMSADTLYHELRRIRQEYSVSRTADIPRNAGCSQYTEMLTSDNILKNYADGVTANCGYVTLREDTGKLFDEYPDVIFENGQGLLLDSECTESYPHVTASRTGITNILSTLSECGKKLDTALYVTRSYITKHGAGPLKNEFRRPSHFSVDKTNISNQWQGGFRYARFDSTLSLTGRIKHDLDSCPYPVRAALLITHLNETDGYLLMNGKNIKSDELISDSSVSELFESISLSYSEYSEEIQTYKTEETK